jgi:transposase
MRQEHFAGEKLFVDYAGKPHIVDPETGEVSDVELFVAVLGASNLNRSRKNGLDRLPSPAEPQGAEGTTPVTHENIRGRGSYH